MKTLWITNVVFPDVCKELKMPEPIVGGWMFSGAKCLASGQDIELAVATLYSGKKLKKLFLNNTTYYLLPFSGDRRKYCPGLESYWREIQLDFKPDVVHIHGTEYTFGLAYIKACGNKNVVVSLQGLASVCERYYYAGMRAGEIIKNITFRDIIRNDNIFRQREKMRLSGEFEKEYLRRVKHIIGRTSWDRTHALNINSSAQYHFCNETLREEFYKHKWSFDKCERHSIFISQANYPIKGLHQLIKAMPSILRRFSDTKVYVAGNNIVSIDTLTGKLRQGGYSKYLKNLIRKIGLDGRIIFKGPLSEYSIVQQYLKSNIFVCPSSIENSPNSVAEAQMLGVPCIASCVGGIPDMVEHGKTGMMYRFEEVEILAELVCDVFSDQNLADNLSTQEQQAALARHSPAKNHDTLITIYKQVIQNKQYVNI